MSCKLQKSITFVFFQDFEFTKKNNGTRCKVIDSLTKLKLNEQSNPEKMKKSVGAIYIC